MATYRFDNNIKLRQNSDGFDQKSIRCGADQSTCEKTLYLIKDEKKRRLSKLKLPDATGGIAQKSVGKLVQGSQLCFEF